MSEVKLLPCPFCGSERIQDDVFVRDGRKVSCLQCGASTLAFNPSGNQKAIAKWNTRIDSRIAALTSERDTERGLRLAADQENDRLRAERDGLKQQVADSDLAFNHANDVVTKLEADVERLSAPVSDAENKRLWCSDIRATVNAIIASRTAPAPQPTTPPKERKCSI